MKAKTKQHPGPKTYTGEELAHLTDYQLYRDNKEIWEKMLLFNKRYADIIYETGAISDIRSKAFSMSDDNRIDYLSHVLNEHRALYRDMGGDDGLNEIWRIAWYALATNTITAPPPIKEFLRRGETIAEILNQVRAQKLVKQLSKTEIGRGQKNKKLYPLDFNKKMQGHLKKLAKENFLTWDGKGKPDFRSKLYLVCLIEYWRSEFYNIQELHSDKIKYPIINDNFLVNGKNPKVNKNYMDGKEYLTHKDETLKSIKKFL